MRALRFARTGDLSDLTLEEVETLQPQDGEVLVRVAAAAINPSDVKNVLGMMPHTTLPRTPGRDFAGTVVQGPPELMGAEVWGSGGEMGFTRDGSHAEFLVLPALGVRPKPAALSFEEAAAVGVPFVTAWSALVDAGQLTPGDVVAVLGAAGAVGNAAVQIARWRGAAAVLGIVRDEAQAARVRQDGVQAIVCQEPGESADAVRAATGGRGATLILDTVGGLMLEPCLDALADRGRLVEIAAPQRRVEFDLLNFYRRQLSLRGINTLALDSTLGARVLAQFAPGFESGALRPPRIAARYSLEQALEAYAAAQKGAGGKVVLAPQTRERIGGGARA